MSLDPDAREKIGVLIGTVDSVLREIRDLREDARRDNDEILAKMDGAEEDRRAHREALLTLTHDVRGVEADVKHNAERMEQEAAITAVKLDKLERWQFRAMVWLSVFGGVGSFLAWLLFDVVQPVLERWSGWKK